MERHRLAMPLAIHARPYLLHDSLFCGGRPDRRLHRSEVAPAVRYSRKRRRRKASSARCSSSENQLSDAWKPSEYQISMRHKAAESRKRYTMNCRPTSRRAGIWK